MLIKLTERSDRFMMEIAINFPFKLNFVRLINLTLQMKNKQLLADISLLLIVFVGGYVANDWFNSKSDIELSSLQECDSSNACFLLENGEEIRLSPKTYIELLDNKIDGAEHGNWQIERRLGTRPVHKSNLERPVYQRNNRDWHQVYIDLRRNEDNKSIKIFTPNVYRQF